MITGVVVSATEAVIPVVVRDARGEPHRVDAVLDTGFTGFLALSHVVITDLALRFAGSIRAALGDGREVSLDVFEGVVLWDGDERDVVVLATGEALVGMSMLAGYRLTMDVQDGGPVTITALS